MPSINPIITTAGRAAVVTAVGLADTITLDDVQLSDTNQAVGIDTTALTDIVATLTATGSVREAGGNYALHVVLTDDSTDVYDVRALAFRLSDGTFLAVYSQAGLIATKAAGASLHIALDFTVDADIAATIDFGDTDYLLPMAGEEAPGLVELATVAEAQTGTDTVRAVTPAGLAARTPAASEGASGLIELATTGEVQTGTDTARAVTPAGLAACTATDTRVGVIELATNAEVQTGTDAVRAVTPAGLQACTATETRKGVVELATTGEAIAGLDTARAVTPAGMEARFTDFLNNNQVLDADLQVQGFTAGTIEFTSAKTREKPIPLDGGEYDPAEWDYNGGTGGLSALSDAKHWRKSINALLPRNGTFKRMRVGVDLNGVAGVDLSVKLQKRTMNPAAATNPALSDVETLTRTADPAFVMDTGTVTHAFDCEAEQWYLEIRSSDNAPGDAVFWVSLTIQDPGEL